MKLTLMQRSLTPIINFLVEKYFPDSSFYGKEYMKVFSDDELVSKWGQPLAVAASFLASSMRDMSADKCEFSFGGMTENGKPVGDWKLTIERTDA